MFTPGLFVGTSGFSYKEWKGSFYPEDLPERKMLEYYAGLLNAVEINNTFYRMPKEQLLRSWADQVPEGFRFILKASQKITHFKRLKEVGEETEYLLRTVRVLGSRLGALLFQLPPNLKKDIPRLEAFLRLLSPDIRAALEFRHATWFDRETFDCLAAHGSALCIADADDELEIPFVRTAGWGYLRLRREAYTEKDLAEWKKKIDGEKWEEVFVFFKHEDGATGPKLARRFLTGAP